SARIFSNDACSRLKFPPAWAKRGIGREEARRRLRQDSCRQKNLLASPCDGRNSEAVAPPIQGPACAGFSISAMAAMCESELLRRRQLERTAAGVSRPPRYDGGFIMEDRGVATAFEEVMGAREAFSGLRLPPGGTITITGADPVFSTHFR